MVLIPFVLSLIRALFLPVISAVIFLHWLLAFNSGHAPKTTKPTAYHPVNRHGLLMSTPDFGQTGLLPLTNVFLMNAWFVQILSLGGYFYSDFLMALGAQVYILLTLVLAAAYIWFGPKFRKPPDKVAAIVPTSEGDNGNGGRRSCFDTKLHIHSPKEIEEVSLASTDCCSINSESAIESESEIDNDKVYHEWDNKRTHEKLSRPRVIKLTSLLGVTGDLKYFLNGTHARFDLRSLTFVIDSGSSDHLCKDKSLFVGKIVPLQHVKLQGVGGLTEAKGYGTIRFKVFDDDGVEHVFTIHNVLYVPDAPMNLLSPQKWIAGLTESERSNRGTMSITFDDVTLLIWGGQRFMKTIHHRPDMGLPLMAVNEGLQLQREQSIMATQFCTPCCPAYMHTSKVTSFPAVIEDGENNPVTAEGVENVGSERLHIIPNDENDIVNNDRDHEVLSDKEVPVAESELVASPNDGNATVADVLLNDDQAEQLITALKRPLSDLEQELLLIHHKLKHLPEKYLHRMAEQGLIPRKFRNVKLPPCAACIFGKQSKRPWRSKASNRQIRRKEHIHPGDGTSVDQLESRHPGLVPQAKGFHRTTAKYIGATVFVDHATGFTYVHLLKDFTGEENLEAKNAYETKAAEYGVRVRNYHGDNGRFSETLWLSDAAEKNQNVSFCGVGSHHQNGIAEKKIRDLTEYARTLLVSANQTWPEAIKLALWPFALKEAERVFNELRLDESGLTPIERFARTRKKVELKHEHPLFCPVFALDATLQGGNSLPRWDPRSRAGVYLGRSKHHASDVALVLNLETGNVSPQYHLTFDDKFSTVDYLRKREVPPFWEDLVRTQSEFYGDSAGYTAGDSTLDRERNLRILKELSEVFVDSIEYPSRPDRLLPLGTPGDLPTANPSPSPQGGPSNDSSTSAGSDQSTASEGEQREKEASSSVPSSRVKRVRFVDELESKDSDDLDLEMQYYDADKAGKRRSGRSRKQPDRLNLTSQRLNSALSSFINFVESNTWSPRFYTALRSSVEAKTPELMSSSQRKEIHAQAMINLNADGTYNYVSPLAFAASKSDNDSYMFHEMLQQPDKDEFVKAMVKELEDHTRRKHWIPVERSKIGNAKPIKAVWSFKRKRRPDGTVSKHKARLCAHGGMQIKGDTFWDTYAPVVNWMSVRLMLTFSEIHQLHTRSIDFTLAFPQADVKVDIYMELPLGCSPDTGEHNKKYVLKLVKNLYGLKDAGKTWFDYLQKGLIDLGFEPSAVDPCIFYKKGITLITYVDDCLIFCKNSKDADELIAGLLKNYDLTDEGELGLEKETVSSYLGVKVFRDKESGEIHLTQPYLIERILELLGTAVDDANIKHTPAEYKSLLHKDLDGPERKQNWSYRSAIGMLNYLAASTRPDILYAVHSAARFSANPKLIHEQAVKRICRYLKGTSDKGMILKPDSSRGIECYVDASFATGWDKSRSEDASTVMSRTGYVIFYMGCPILFVSKMQTEIALSTTEAEYIALSQAMRDLIPFTTMAAELGTVYSNEKLTPKILCRLFEDNNGALLLAKEHRYRPRTKHIALKYHHFRSFVKEGKVDILPIDTKEQIADQFTKSLDLQTFKYLRGKLMGW